LCVNVKLLVPGGKKKEEKGTGVSSKTWTAAGGTGLSRTSLTSQDMCVGIVGNAGSGVD
jgi:hypothetical protein